MDYPIHTYPTELARLIAAQWAITPAGLQVLRLTEERTFRENEIRRLSPSATLDRSLIGVRWDPAKGFLLWGIINSGTRWVNETDGSRRAKLAIATVT